MPALALIAESAATLALSALLILAVSFVAVLVAFATMAPPAGVV